MTNPTKVISYCRVSTAKQGASGLGLEAQVAAVAGYVAANGCELVAEYFEIETARKDDLENRPELRRALAHCKRLGATLIIAKLDRLARSVLVTAELHRSSVEFIACDNATASRFTIQILAAVAEQESRMISERTRAAMQAAKARGRNFGTPQNLTAEARHKGTARAAETRSRLARESYADLVPLVTKMRADGLSLGKIAKALNDLGHTTRHHRPWTAVQASRIIARYGAAA